MIDSQRLMYFLRSILVGYVVILCISLGTVTSDQLCGGEARVGDFGDCDDNNDSVAESVDDDEPDDDVLVMRMQARLEGPTIVSLPMMSDVARSLCDSDSLFHPPRAAQF